MRILLSAYACEPGIGSEPGIGWHWALEIARLGNVPVEARALRDWLEHRGELYIQEQKPLAFVGAV